MENLRQLTGSSFRLWRNRLGRRSATEISCDAVGTELKRASVSSSFVGLACSRYRNLFCSSS